ncbi:MAG: zinc-dependent metalloprotease [Deltaproteobacteria bacterium]|nr:zinc-dependent metalloprotease [Deltaproteobacteria bacterium]
MSRFKGWSWLAVAAAVVAGCGEGAGPEDVAADPNINNSFIVGAPQGKADTIGTNRANITIKRDALGKEFLLQSNWIFPWGAPMFGATQSRIVYFKEVGRELFMLEAPSDYALDKSQEVDMKLVLAKFPIVARPFNDFLRKEITFDFNQGMAQIFVDWDWWTPDFDYPDPLRTFAVPVDASYIESAKADRADRVTITQVGKAKHEWGNFPFTVKYYLSPYRPDPTYKPLAAPATMDDMGFFQVTPKAGKNDRTYVSKVARFHPEKQTTWALSTNTPVQFRQAVRDGVLYWNKALGREFFKVVDAPAGVSAPNPDYNVIQWVDAPTVGFAYADAQMDPRTGQVLHAQVFLSSIFAVYGKADAQALLRRQEAHKLSDPVSKYRTKHRWAGLKGLGARFQHIRDAREVYALARQALTTGASDAQVLEAAANVVRSVVAHEVGHCLGLRHNFAASQDANAAPETFDNHMTNFLKGQPTRAATAIPSSSVMDYLTVSADFVAGQRIALGQPGLEYDVQAASVLYKGASVVPGKHPIFCSDLPSGWAGLFGAYQDCQAYDVGRNPIEFAKWYRKEILDNLASHFFEQYVGAKSPTPGDQPVALNYVDLYPKYYAMDAVTPLFTAFRGLTTAAKTLAVRRTFGVANDANQKEVLLAEYAATASRLTANGGYAGAFGWMPKDFAETAAAKFDKLVAAHGTTTGFFDQKVSFSDAEKTLMKATARAAFKKVAELGTQYDLTLLGNGQNPYESEIFMQNPWLMEYMQPSDSGKIADQPMTKKLPAYAAERVADVLLSETGKKITGEITVTVEPAPPAEGEEPPAEAGPTEKKIKVSLPVYFYPVETRVVAAGLFMGMQAEFAYYGKVEKKALDEKYTDAMNALYEGTVKDPHLLPSALSHWFADREAVEGALGADMSGGMPPGMPPM